MLELRDIRKTYKVGNIETKALDGVSVSFREKEFVAILGASGSGKTTCLNIIGGLDRYDGGEMLINGKDTRKFKDRDWDAYRNNSVGFVFQSYNLIPHLSIVANVEMGMTLSGVSKAQKHKKALDALEQVGLKDHLHKKPNQLSGGQMQRVAIARALANDPDILLCDEPTGALDTNTGVQIMELIKSLSADRLVIMVTHNPSLANDYADRIISFSDGKIVSDTDPYKAPETEDTLKLKKTSMSFITAMSLSLNNIKTKKGRTFLTSFASSIGIIGIALILSLSSGFQVQIQKFQDDAMGEFPIIISKNAVVMDEESMKEFRGMMTDKQTASVDSDEIYLYDPSESKLTHKNELSDEYLDYIENVSKEDCPYIGYVRMTGMNILSKNGDSYVNVKFGSDTSNTSRDYTSMKNAGLASYPESRGTAGSYVEANYDLLSGEYPKSETDIIIVADSKNRLDINTMTNLGFETSGIDSIKFSDIVGREYKLIPNDDYYQKSPYGVYTPGADLKAAYESENALTLRICGIVRLKSDVDIGVLGTGAAYSDSLVQKVVKMNENSDIVNQQKKSDISLFSGEKLTDETKDQTLLYLGAKSEPLSIMMYPKDFDAKERIVSYLDKYNNGKSEQNTVVYTDLSETITEMTGGIMDAITYVLIAFSSVSLIVSLIMISIITYISVLERTKEIGILKALGARKKDITRVFDAETCWLGLFSGLLGIIIAFLLTFPINAIIYDMTEIADVAQLNPVHALVLVAISTLLTMAGGHIPAKIAARKDAVEALRSE